MSKGVDSAIDGAATDGGNIEDNDDDSDFHDSGYDLAEDDDDIWIDNVDEDESSDKGKKATGSKLKGKRIQNLNLYGDDSTDDSDLELLESDGENQGRLRFKRFRAEDMGNPTFKVGMVFESPELLRKAVIEYNIKHRVEIKAHCEVGCPWNLHASTDKRTEGLMVKTYFGQHNCQRKWKFQRCTSKWLAEKYVDFFRAD